MSGKFLVGAVRLFWRDVNLDYKNGKKPAPVRYIFEGICEGRSFVLVDASAEGEELIVDYKTFDMTLCE